MASMSKYRYPDMSGCNVRLYPRADTRTYLLKEEVRSGYRASAEHVRLYVRLFSRARRKGRCE